MPTKTTSLAESEQATDQVLSELIDVSHTFRSPSGKVLTVLEDIQLSIRPGELVAILGPSGCGKSTLTRIAAGLLQPSRGQILYRGQPCEGANPNVALVFQQFALYPWLTVSQNIEQVLIPRRIDPEERKKRITEVISLIGLEGFEEAYPRELSGGMKQRVGLARALVVHPELLCMDEPFSQVDPLTAETLRHEVVHLWADRGRYPASIFMVSHDIHEVASMATRILIMTANPGRIKTVINNSLPYPRDQHSRDYVNLVDKLHDIITGLYMPDATPQETGTKTITYEPPTSHIIAPIPLVEVRDIIGLLETIDHQGGSVELFQLTAEIDTAFTRLLLAIKAGELLGLLQTPQDRLVITDLGHQFVTAPRKQRKELFRHQLLQLPLIRRLRDILEQRPDHQLPKEIYLEELAIQCPQEDFKRLFRILVNWGHFADLWTYQAHTATILGSSTA